MGLHKLNFGNLVLSWPCITVDVFDCLLVYEAFWFDFKMIPHVMWLGHIPKFKIAFPSEVLVS